MTLALTEKKMEKIILKCHNLLSLPSNHCFGINKTDRSDVLNYPSSSAISSTSKYLQQQQIQSLNQACS